MLKKFKPAKCKTALNLSKSRIKLLKNKKENQLKQLRREVAQLLESGQDQTARIRVEHVVREEKTLGAFELIQIYSELVVARLPIIESQKNCPLDLKEAIASLIFAAPRCGDIPELEEVRKHFIAKYGKEFVVAATELRPNCGVSRNLVEKLSVKAPDGPEKVKILTAIAEEHNIKWEPNWFKDEDPMPSVEIPKQQHAEKPGMIQMEPLNFEIADNIQKPQVSASSSQNYSRANITVNAVPPSMPHLDARPSGSYSDRMPRNDFETDRPSWTMEFKDATAAAQVAAESAERASMAARAAAELSRRSSGMNNISSGSMPLSRRDSNEDRKVFSNTSSYNQRMQQVGGYEQGSKTNNTSGDKKVFSNTSFNNQRTERIHVDQVGIDARGLKQNPTEPGVQFGNKKEYYRETEDSINPIYQEPLPTPRCPEHEYDVYESPKHQVYDDIQDDEFSLHEETVQPGSFKAQSGAFGDEYGIFSNLNDRNNDSYSDDEHYGSSSHQKNANYDDWNVEPASDSGTFDSRAGDRDGVLHTVDQEYGLNSSEGIFASIDHNTNEMDNVRAVFDDSGSDEDKPIFNFAEKPYDPPSPVKSSTEHSAFHQEKLSSFSSRSRNTLGVSESFRESSLYAKLNEPVPMRFDWDGESSEDEKQTPRDREHHIDPDVTEIKESESVYAHSSDLYTNEPSSERPISQEELRDYERLESKNETPSGMELNYGVFPTGRRNRRQFDPPYRRGIEIDASSSPKISQESIDKALDFHDSSSEAESTEVSVKPKTEIGLNNEETPYSPTTRKTLHKTVKGRTGFFYSEGSSSSSDDITPTEASRKLLDPRLSRRTKGPKPSDTLDRVPHSTSRTPEIVPKVQTRTSTSQVRPKTKVSEDVYSARSPITEKQTATPKKETEISNASSSSGKAPSRENSAKKPDHVHPNLPDFETLTAHMLSLKTNRQK